MNATTLQSRTPASPWRAPLIGALRGRAEPLVVLPTATIPAASIWVSTRLWTSALRAMPLAPGDRIVIAARPSVGTLALLIAALWEGLTIAMAPPGVDPDEALLDFDARLILADRPGTHAVTADNAGCPEIHPAFLPRDPLGPPTPEARLLLRTSGTSGSPRWVALSDANLWTVLDAHRPRLCRPGDAVLSVLPWHHAFGLVIDLLPALLSASTIVLDPSAGRDPIAMARVARQWDIAWCSMVPLQAQRLADTPPGRDMLASLRGGIVGGAPVSAALAGILAGTRLMPGYGQTEAGPGITLGQPGKWSAHALGAPLGCRVRIDAEGRLLVQGENVCLGLWQERRLLTLPAGRWLDTGDLVAAHDGQLWFLGRADHNFKLSNGRFVHAAALEDALRRADPGIADAMLSSPDGERLRLLVILAPGALEPAPDSLRRVAHGVLGTLAERIVSITFQSESHVHRTPKGAIDRRRLATA